MCDLEISSSKKDAGEVCVREAQNCLHCHFGGALDFGLVVHTTKKTVMSKKKVIAARNLERLDQVYHSNQLQKQKKFNATVLCFPECV